MGDFQFLTLYLFDKSVHLEAVSPSIAYSSCLQKLKYIDYNRINLDFGLIGGDDSFIGLDTDIVTSYLRFDYEGYFRLDNDNSRWNFFISSICESLVHLWNTRNWNIQDLILARDSLLNKEREMTSKILVKREQGYTLKLWVNYTFRENIYFLDIVSGAKQINKSIFINKGRTGFVQWYLLFNKLLYFEGSFIIKDLFDNTILTYDIERDELLDNAGNPFHPDALFDFEHFALWSKPW
jgi:hypothetical protein